MYSDYCYKLKSTNQSWYNNYDGELYAYWTKISETYKYPVVISNADEDYKYYYTNTMTHGGNITITAPIIDGCTFSKMWVNGYDREGSSYTIYDVQLKRNLVYDKNNPESMPFYLWYPGYGSPQMNQGGLFMVYTKNECVAEGTLITLADGSQKAVETLIGNEMLLVWNMHTGKFDVAPILFIDSGAARYNKVINLHFSDGTIVKAIDEHGFWNHNLNKYVFLRDDAAQYIGHYFNKQITKPNGKIKSIKVQLVNVVISTEFVSTWSPVTYGHLSYYVNGMLSMPGATEGLINIFEVNAKKMRIDNAAFEADIETYGLFTYDEFNQTYSVPEVIFEAFGGQYLKVSIGKGLITEDKLGQLIASYSKFFQAEDIEIDESNNNFNYNSEDN